MAYFSAVLLLVACCVLRGHTVGDLLLLPKGYTFRLAGGETAYDGAVQVSPETKTAPSSWSVMHWTAHDFELFFGTSSRGASAAALCQSFFPAVERQNSDIVGKAFRLPSGGSSAMWWSVVQGLADVHPSNSYDVVVVTNASSPLRLVEHDDYEEQQDHIMMGEEERVLGGARNEASRAVFELYLDCTPTQQQQQQPHRNPFLPLSSPLNITNYFIGITSYWKHFYAFVIARFINISATRIFFNPNTSSIPSDVLFDGWDQVYIYNFSIVDDGAWAAASSWSFSGDDERYSQNFSTAYAVEKLKKLNGRQAFYFLGMSQLYSHAPHAAVKACKNQWFIDSNSSMLRNVFGLVRMAPMKNSEFPGTLATTLLDTNSSEMRQFTMGFSSNYQEWIPGLNQTWKTNSRVTSRLLCEGVNPGRTFKRTALIPSWLSSDKGSISAMNLQCKENASSLLACRYLSNPVRFAMHSFDTGIMCGANLLQEFPPVQVSFTMQTIEESVINESLARLANIYNIPMERINVTAVQNSSLANLSTYCENENITVLCPNCCDGCGNASQRQLNPFCSVTVYFSIAYIPAIDGPNASHFNGETSSDDQEAYTIHDYNLMLANIDPDMLKIVGGWEYCTISTVDQLINGTYNAGGPRYTASYWSDSAEFVSMLPPPATPEDTRGVQSLTFSCPTRTISLPTTPPPPTTPLPSGMTTTSLTKKPLPSATRVPFVPPKPSHSNPPSAGSRGASSSASTLKATNGGIILVVLLCGAALAVVGVCFCFRKVITDDRVEKDLEGGERLLDGSDEELHVVVDQTDEESKKNPDGVKLEREPEEEDSDADLL